MVREEGKGGKYSRCSSRMALGAEESVPSGMVEMGGRWTEQYRK
jgi:hypothetical protein